MTGAAKRIVLETLGWVLLVLGIAALFLPGPGLLGIFAGLALLSQQYEWAERHVEPVRLHALLGRPREWRRCPGSWRRASVPSCWPAAASSGS